MDVEKSLAKRPGGNEYVKKKKKGGHLSWYELMGESESLLEQYIFEILTENRPHQITLYHGTALSNFESIWDTGFEAKIPPGVLGAMNRKMAKGVYLTANPALAARYAISSARSLGSIPIVLELSISKPRRVKKFIYDPLDREGSENENLGGDPPDMDVDHEVFFDEIHELISNVISDLGLEINVNLDYYSGFFSYDFELDDIEGASIYSIVLHYLPKEVNRRDVVRSVNSYISPGDKMAEGNIVISNSRTLHRTEDYYSSREQLIYPNEIDSSSIKRVFLKKKDFPSIAGEIMKIAPKTIPGDRTSIYQNRDAFIKKYILDVNYKSKEIDFDEMLDNLEGLNFDELEELLDNKEQYDSYEEFMDDLENEFITAQDIMEEDLYSDTPFESESDWIIIPPQIALKLSQDM